MILKPAQASRLLRAESSMVVLGWDRVRAGTWAPPRLEVREDRAPPWSQTPAGGRLRVAGPCTALCHVQSQSCGLAALPEHSSSFLEPWGSSLQPTLEQLLFLKCTAQVSWPESEGGEMWMCQLSRNKKVFPSAPCECQKCDSSPLSVPERSGLWDCVKN